MMNQEEKELLIKDLCTRAPYGVKVRNVKMGFDIYDFNHNVKEIRTLIEEYDIKPYLRSMSSMTDEEFKEYHSMLIDIDKSGLMIQKQITRVVDWLDRKMFDHRGLIPKRLALKAPEGMYKSD